MNDNKGQSNWIGLDPTIWGSPTWFYGHSVTLSYPENPSQDDQITMKNFFENLVFPCTKCNYHYKKHWEKYPLTEQILASKKSVIQWFIDVHNEVNKYKKKPELTIDEMMELYQDIYGNGKNTKNYIIIGLALVAIGCWFKDEIKKFVKQTSD
jgi:FAD-linked sulfhydryl oxidase